MFIDRLRLLNFRQHERTEVVFGQGLTGIVGPNGAGKTTILEAIAWAMYGMRAARGNRDTIRRRGAPPRSRVEVELEFRLGAHRYRVLRSLNTAELWQDGEAAPIANSIDSVTERITRLLGMTRDEFFNTYFTGQKELAVMAAMTAGERAQFLSRVLGYEKLKLAQDELRDARSLLRSRHATLLSGLVPLADILLQQQRADERVAAAATREQAALAAVAAGEGEVARLRPEWEAACAARERVARLEAELALAEQAARTEDDQVRRLDGEVQVAEQARRRLAELEPSLGAFASLREQMAAFAADAQGYARRTQVATQLDGLRRRRADLAERLAAAPDETAAHEATARLEAVRAALEATTAEHADRRTQWVQDQQEAKTKRDGLAEHYRDLAEQRERIEQAGEDGKCPTCARPLGGEFAAVLGMLQEQLDEVTANGTFYKQRMEQLREPPPELAELKARLDALQAEVQEASAAEARLAQQRHEAERVRREAARVAEELGRLEGEFAALPGAQYDPHRHHALEREFNELQKLSLDAERQRTLSADAETLAAELAAARTRAAEAGTRVAALRAGITGTAFARDAYLALEGRVQAADRALAEGRHELVRAQSELGSAREQQAMLAERRREREAREAEAQRVALEIRMNEELDRALADLRTDLNATLRPELSEVASGFLRDLTNGRYTDLELNEDYEAALVDEGEAKGVISGGEEDVSNLALRLAISQMIAERAGQPLSLLVLDEIFGSLDEDRRTAVLELLRSLADRFPQVILITHIDTVRDGFDRIIRVTYDARRGVAEAADEPVGGSGDVAA
jgi:exonuclease SbcC